MEQTAPTSVIAEVPAPAIKERAAPTNTSAKSEAAGPAPTIGSPVSKNHVATMNLNNNSPRPMPPLGNRKYIVSISCSFNRTALRDALKLFALEVKSSSYPSKARFGRRNSNANRIHRSISPKIIRNGNRTTIAGDTTETPPCRIADREASKASHRFVLRWSWSR
jgi:hypothetical protein